MGHETGTTHAEWGAGSPRLLASSDDTRLVHLLEDDRTTIGSAADCTLRCPGADPLHAEIVHDDRDEYVLTLHGDGELTAHPEAAATHEGARSQTLRTGARFTAGDWTFVFAREEWADHGRPYGGREGGELSDQPAQPARPDYDGDGSPARGREIQDY